MSIIQKLTEGIVNRDMKAEGQAILNKWSQTGLLEGLESEHKKSTMARLLENQAKELLRESSTLAAGEAASPGMRNIVPGYRDGLGTIQNGIYEQYESIYNLREQTEEDKLFKINNSIRTLLEGLENKDNLLVEHKNEDKAQ